MRPGIRFAKCDGIAVAYQTFGEGPDLAGLPEPWRVFAVGSDVPEKR